VPAWIVAHQVWLAMKSLLRRDNWSYLRGKLDFLLELAGSAGCGARYRHLVSFRTNMFARSWIESARMRKLNVLIVTADFYPDTFGGVERCVYEIEQRAGRARHNVAVVARRSGAISRSARRWPVSRPPVLHALAAAPALPDHRGRGAWQTARKVLGQAPFDIVHVHEALPAVL